MFLIFWDKFLLKYDWKTNIWHINFTQDYQKAGWFFSTLFLLIHRITASKCSFRFSLNQLLQPLFSMWATSMPTYDDVMTINIETNRKVRVNIGCDILYCQLPLQLYKRQKVKVNMWTGAMYMLIKLKLVILLTSASLGHGATTKYRDTQSPDKVILIYDWNIVNCDVKQPFTHSLTVHHFTKVLVYPLVIKFPLDTKWYAVSSINLSHSLSNYFFFSPPAHLWGRHIYDWNIVDCDVKQPIHLHLTTSEGMGQSLSPSEAREG